MPDERNPFEQAVDQWHKRGYRGRSGRHGTDKAPMPLFELPGYFQKLPVARLAGCWVACITEACLQSDFTAGDMARALVVVAERLHGLRFEAVGDPPVIQLKDEKACQADSTKATSLISGSGMLEEHFLLLERKRRKRRSKS